MSLRPLAEVTDPGRYGGKAAQLGASLRAGLPVPDGFALSVDAVEAVVAGDEAACAHLLRVGTALSAPMAVRSSGVGEDGTAQSFAGQHLSLLNVGDGARLREAVVAVHASGNTQAARAYRARMGVAGEARVAIVVQRLVDATCAGVMFTRDPLNGAEVRVVEASWGLGEVVVQGLVTPDRARLSPRGEVLEHVAGWKDLAMRRAPDGGVHEVALDESAAGALCLDRAKLAALSELASRCEGVFGAGRDIEWAFAGDALYLLQVRAITARGVG